MTMRRGDDMHSLTDEQLDTLLAQHRPPRADSSLEQRIMAAAVPRSTPRISPWNALLELLRPAPVAAFACSLLLGVMAGQFLPENAVAPQPTPVQVPKISHNAGAFLYYNGEVL